MSFEQAPLLGVFQNFAERFVAVRGFDEVRTASLQRNLYV
jgi:hypothetical protein